MPTFDPHASASFGIPGVYHHVWVLLCLFIMEENLFQRFIKRPPPRTNGPDALTRLYLDVTKTQTTVALNRSLSFLHIIVEACTSVIGMAASSVTTQGVFFGCAPCCHHCKWVPAASCTTCSNNQGPRNALFSCILHIGFFLPVQNAIPFP